MIWYQSFILACILTVLVLLLLILNKSKKQNYTRKTIQERFNQTIKVYQAPNIGDTDPKFIIIPHSGDLIYSISGLVPNSWAKITIDDASLIFQVDSNGNMHWNDNKDPLPIYLLPSSTIRIYNTQGYTNVSPNSPMQYLSPFWTPPCLTHTCPEPNSKTSSIGPLNIRYGSLAEKVKELNMTFDLTRAPPEWIKHLNLTPPRIRQHIIATITNNNIKLGQPFYTE
jgi:hypothetical protein